MMVLPEVPKMETSLTKTKLNGHSIIFQIASEFGSWFLLRQSVPSREGWGVEGVFFPRRHCSVIISPQDSARMICEGKVVVIAIVSTGLPSAFQSHANSLRLQHICLHHKTTNEYK